MIKPSQNGDNSVNAFRLQSTLVLQMKTLGVDVEWIPGRDAPGPPAMEAMKRSASVLSSTAVSGDGVRTAASARAAGPRRWVPRAVRLRGAPTMVLWCWLTVVRVVRRTSVDHCGRRTGGFGVLGVAHVAASVFLGRPCSAVRDHLRRWPCPVRELRRRLVARKIVRGMRRRTAHVTACIRARAWMLEPLPSRARSRTLCMHRNR